MQIFVGSNYEEGRVYSTMDPQGGAEIARDNALTQIARTSMAYVPENLWQDSTSVQHLPTAEILVTVTIPEME